MIGVGTLEVMRRGSFGLRNGVWRSVDCRSEQPAKDLVGRSIISAKPVTEVETRGAGGGVQLRRCGTQTEPIGRCDHATDRALARPQVLLYTCYAVTRGGLDKLPRGSAEAVDDVGIRRACQSLEDTDGKPAIGFPRDFYRAGDSRLLRLAYEQCRRIGADFRRATNAPRIKQNFVCTFVDGEGEQAAVLHKERPSFLKGRLGTRDVDFGRIGFHLAEIRMHRQIESQAIAESELGVETSAAIERR